MRTTISDLIIATIASGRSVKTFRSILYNSELQKHKKESVQVVFSRLHKNKFVKHSISGWSLTQKGKNRANNPLTYIPSPFSNDAPQSTIISFDIPEANRHLRNWLRNQLKIFDYKMLQQSLWLGPGPLPKEFIERLKKLKIKENIKIFSKIRKT